MNILVISNFSFYRSYDDEHFYVRTTWGDWESTSMKSNRVELKTSALKFNFDELSFLTFHHRGGGVDISGTVEKRIIKQRLVTQR